MRLSELPQFTITEATGGPGDWVLHGHFNHLETVHEGRSWLYVSRAGSLIGDLHDLDRVTREAHFSTPDSLPDGVLGTALPWLDGWWQAYHVALILDGAHEWHRVTFGPLDAVERRIGAWRELRPAVEEPPQAGEALVPGAWDHEHCMLCNVHIDLGDTAYADTEEHWLCLSCYESYARRQDLAFVRRDT